MRKKEKIEYLESKIRKTRQTLRDLEAELLIVRRTLEEPLLNLGDKVKVKETGSVFHIGTIVAGDLYSLFDDFRNWQGCYEYDELEKQ